MDILINILFVILTIITIVLGYLALRRRRPIYAVCGTTLISSSAVEAYPGLEIRFHGEQVEGATVSEICLWNAGNETIRKEDIAPTDSLRVVAIDPTCTAKIISCEMVSASRKQVNASLTREEQVLPNPFAETPEEEEVEDVRYILSFDFLEHDDYIHIRAIHTGSRPDSCNIKGTVIGCKGGVKRLYGERKSPLELACMLIFATMLLVFPTFFESKSASNHHSFYQNFNNWLHKSPQFSLSVLTVFALSILTYCAIWIRRYLINLVPNKVLKAWTTRR